MGDYIDAVWTFEDVTVRIDGSPEEVIERIAGLLGGIESADISEGEDLSYLGFDGFEGARIFARLPNEEAARIYDYFSALKGEAQDMDEPWYAAEPDELDYEYDLPAGCELDSPEADAFYQDAREILEAADVRVIGYDGRDCVPMDAPPLGYIRGLTSLDERREFLHTHRGYFDRLADTRAEFLPASRWSDPVHYDSELIRRGLFEAAIAGAGHLNRARWQ